MAIFLQSFTRRVLPWSLLVLASYFLTASILPAQDLFLNGDLEQVAPNENKTKTDAKSQPEQAKSEEESKSAKQTEAESKSSEQPAKTDEPSQKSESSEPSGKAEEKSTDTTEKTGESLRSEDTSKPIVHSSKPHKSPHPDELKVRPDAAGNVRFNFNGQPWQPVLEWLAEISGKSLDWQDDLPTGKVNINTQSSYTVEEARDLINRYLLMRGYTLLCQGDILSLANIKKINPSLVPRVTPQELDKHLPHEFVKVSFPLDWMLAEIAVEELKPMLSPNGKLVPLKNTNRLEAYDAVINLREIWSLLKEEQSDTSQERLVREFRLKYARASEVCEQLQTLLSAETKAGTEATPQQQQPEMPRGMPPGMDFGPGGFMGSMMQMMGGRGGDRGDRGDRFGRSGSSNISTSQKPKDFTLVVNPRMNSILAHATPDKMAIISQAIEAIDVPSDNTQSLVSNLNRMQVYRLTGVDPDPVVKTLQEIGNLDPGTRLQVDAKNKAIIAYASLADHFTIRTVVKKLSGSERRFEVIPLRRLEADYVYGSIEFMMGGMKQDRSSQTSQANRNPFFGGRGFPQPQTTTNVEQKTDEFRVDADVEHNRLLVWANDVELAEVENLLVKLGEIPPQGSRQETVRIIDTYNIKEAEELIERIRRAWPSTNPLLVNPPPASPKPSLKPSEEKPSLPELPPKSAAGELSPPNPFKLVQFRREEEKTTPPSNAATEQKVPPPVEVTLDADGRIIISSDDPEALTLFEDLMIQFAPPRKNYHVFQLKYSLAYGVSQNLEEFFMEEEKTLPQTQQGRRNPFFFNPFAQDTSQPDARTSLSKRRPLKFIPDADSNTVMVVNADATQLKTIEELIKLYDQPTPTDSQSVRKMETINLQYSKAKTVAETVKEVYRDLLSSNDKSLQTPGAGPGQRTPNFMYLLSGEGENTGQKAPKFKGLLSIGVDELSNSLVVSAPAFLFDQVVLMIKELDDAAAPSSTIRVVKLGQGVSGDKTREVLSAILGQVESRSSSQAAQFQQGQRFRQPGQQQGQQQGRGNRGSTQQNTQGARRGGGGGAGGGGGFGGGGR